MKTILQSLVVAAALAFSAGGSAYATDCPVGYRYETTVCYETRRVSYTVCETRYDECGRCYQVTVTRYRTVRVAVTHRVLVRAY